MREIFYDHLVLERGLSENTLLAYKRDIEDYFSRFQTLEVPVNEFQRYFSNLKEKYCSATVARKISAVRSMYKFLYAQGYINTMPTKILGKSKKEKKIPNYLTGEEIKMIMESVPGDYEGVRDKTILDILVFTGARVSEVVDLNVSAVDFLAKTIRFQGKGEKVRILPINDVLLESLDNYIKNFRKLFAQGIKEELFPHMTRNNFWHRVKKYSERAGIKKKVSPHVFRHSLATIMLGKGANIRYVQEILGHSDVSTTEIYTHVNKKDLKDLYNKIDHRNKD